MMKAALVLLVVAVGAANACRFPPRMWCDSAEIAQQCQVSHQCKEFVQSSADRAQAPPVSLELYIESLCPDCQLVLVQQLYPTYLKIGNIMNITLFPYGNAKETKDGDKWKFECQHGEEECVGNMLETCAIHVLNGNTAKILPIFHCMDVYLMASEKHHVMKAMEICAKSHELYNSIMSCYNSSLGNQLEHQMAARTDALKPPHKYVPWVVLNGVHTEKINNEAAENLLKLICDTYTGPKPAACSQSETQTHGCPKFW